MTAMVVVDRVATLSLVSTRAPPPLSHSRTTTTVDGRVDSRQQEPHGGIIDGALAAEATTGTRIIILVV